MSPRIWGRRDFLLSLGGGALTLAVRAGGGVAGLGEVVRPGLGRLLSGTRTVRVGCVLPPGGAGQTSGIEAGILLGREESEQVGALLGVKLDLRVERVGSPEEVEDAATRLMNAGVQVLVGAAEPPVSRELNRTASLAGVPFVDALPSRVPSSPCAHPAFRVGVHPATGMGLALEALTAGDPGGPTLLVADPGDPQVARARETLTRQGHDPRIVDASTPGHTLSDEVRSLNGGDASGSPRILLVGPDALAWAFRPDAAGTPHPVLATIPLQPGGPVPVLPIHAPALWHSGLIRFGAAQLNERHERRFGAPMDPSAWAGWFVVKLLWEAILREGAGGSEGSLAERLMDPATRFDGHKGVGIGFRSDGILRQPLYLVRTDPDGGSEVVHEGPVVSRGTPFAAAFDSLGPTKPSCPGGGPDPIPPTRPAP